MKILLAYSVALVTLLSGSSFISEPVNPVPVELEWHSQLEKARLLSEQTGKPIFGFFTGSDWCGWCHRLQDNVFKKESFKTWAAENVILLELDFPRRKALPPELAEQNNGLKNFFQVQGFPTIWIFEAGLDQETKQYQINALGSLGYPRSNPGEEDKVFISQANQILLKKK